MKRERKKKTQQSNTKKRGNPWLELSYSLNPPPGNTIQSSFVLFTDDTVFDITLYTSRANEFPFNPHYTLLL